VDEAIVVVVPLVSGFVGLGICWLMVRYLGWWVLALWALILLTAAGLFYSMITAVGHYAGLGEAILLYGIVAPFSLGALIGTVIGAVRRRNATG
jgi:hypothetical protein